MASAPMAAQHSACGKSVSSFSTGLAHVIGDKSTPLLNDTIGQHLRMRVREHGDRPALIVDDQAVRWNYGELYSKSISAAQGLLDMGLTRGDRLGVFMPNCQEWAVMQFASSLIGVILVSINPANKLLELQHALQLSGCRALVMAPSFATSDYIATVRELAPEIDALSGGAALHAEGLPDLRSVVVATACGRTSPDPSLLKNLPGFMSYEDVFGDRGDDAGLTLRIESACDALDPHDPVNIQFTSGTTGQPKGASLTHHNILNNGRFIGRGLGLSAEDRVCIPVPLYHCFGSVLGNMACLTHGSAMVYPKAGFDPEATLRVASAEKCTTLYGVPTMFINELSLPNFGDFELSSLRTGIMAGSVCPIEVMHRIMDEMNMTEVTIAYGMTETSPVSFQGGRDDPPKVRAETVGRVHPHVECKVVAVNEDGLALDGADIMPRAPRDDASNQDYAGELWTRGYVVMDGYWNDPDRTKEAVTPDGWMRTGDLATIDEDGFCRIVGRLKDVIIRGGENIFPREIEDVLFESDLVQNISAVGVPSERLGEEVAVWVVPTPKGEELGDDAFSEAIKGFVRDRAAHYKVPRYVLSVRESDIPLTVSGKIKKFVMKERTVDLLGL